MSCSACLRDVRIVAKGLCAACYQRKLKRGTTEYAPLRVRGQCSIRGCERPHASLGYCQFHYERVRATGSPDQTKRPDSWGAKTKHPLYNRWAHMMRHRTLHPVAEQWQDFLQFVADIGEAPDKGAKLFAANEDQPIGPANHVWKRAFTERVDGEDEKTFTNRRARAYRHVQSERGHGYGLKLRYGLSAGTTINLVSKDTTMPTMGQKMKPLDEEILRLDAEIARLQGERAGLLRAKDLLTGTPPEKVGAPRKRAPSVKPLVLDIMAQVERAGATTSEVDGTVRLTNPDVAKDTVGSVLSRLKSEGALVYDGDRYYEKRFAPTTPQPRPWEAKIVG